MQKLIGFWEDLSANSGLISDTFNTAVDAAPSGGTVSGTQLNVYMPQGKIGYNTYVMALSQNGLNYFHLAVIYDQNSGTINEMVSGYWRDAAPGRANDIPAPIAAAFDTKVDDGLPLTGTVQSASSFGNYCYNQTTSLYYLSGNNANGTLPYCALFIKMQSGD